MQDNALIHTTQLHTITTTNNQCGGDSENHINNGGLKIRALRNDHHIEDDLYNDSL